MNLLKRIGKLVACLALACAITGTLIPGLTDFAYADAGDTPSHDKTIAENGDGTYKLELSVTGDADTKVETAANANVLIVYDVSQSMTNNVSGSNRSRADYAEDVVHDFIEKLRGYQNASDPSNIEAALVTFGPNAAQRSGWTSNLTGNNTGINRFFDDGVDGTTDPAGVFSYSNNLGTNWDHALILAENLLTALDNSNDTDPTFVIFVTDGVCTKSGTGGGNGESPTNTRWSHYSSYYDAATDNAYNIEQRDNTTLFGIYAYGTEADLLDDLIYYANEGSHRTMTVGGTERSIMDIPDSGNLYQTYNFGETTDTANYFNANNTEALNQAIESIFHTIVEALGVTSVQISDGTTNQVETSTTIEELLEVDTSSYQYWLSIPIDANNQFQRIDSVSGETITYTVSSDGKTITWGTNSVTVNGDFVSEGGQRYIKYEWTGSNDLYDKNPPTAVFDEDTGAVNWNLSDVGTLLDGVKYSVTFDVYPSQTSLDIVADIKNDPYISEEKPGAWGDLDPAVQKYIDKQGNLSTNTTASLKWNDTRPGGGSGEDTYDNPDPVETKAVEQLAVSKEWDNQLEQDWDKPDNLTLGVTRDTEQAYSVTLNDGNSWKDTVYISIGIMRTNDEGEMEVLEGSEGHDFTFTEPQIQDDFHWELDVPTVHPMMIDGVLTSLVKVDAKHPLPDGATHYTINKDEYYVDDASVSLTATNQRRSSVNLTKVVDGDDADPDAIFPWTIHVKDPLAPESAPSEEADPGHASDYWIWISVRDKDGNRITEGVEGAVHDGGGWWYAANDTDVTIPVKAGYSIRLNNLPTDSTYSITEGDLPKGFTFEKGAIEVIDGVGEVTEEDLEVDKDNKKVSSKIKEPNTIYKVTLTNKYELRNVTVTKEWDDNSNQDGKRPATLDLTLNAPEGVDVPDPEIAKSEDGNSWTYTWKGLPKVDASGTAIEYTVTEGTVPNGYECTTTTVDAGGTIVNKHTPSTIDVTVNKFWDDNSNQDGKRPETLDLTLNNLPEGTTAPTPTITESTDGNTWTYTWAGVPEYSNGSAISYTMTEGTVPDGYTCETKTVAKGGTITNKHTPSTIDVTVNKFWDDNSNQDGKRPETLDLTLNNLPEGTAAPTPTITESTDGNTWTYTWAGVPEYSNGSAISYTMTEGTVPDGYTCETKTVAKGGTITNKHTPETVDLTITKVWKDGNNADKLRKSASEFKNYLTLTPDVGKDPTVTDNGDGTYTIKYTGLPKYTNKILNTYTVTESPIDGYTTTGSPAEDGGEIVNKHTPVKNATIVGLKVLEGRSLVDKEFKFLIKGTYEELPSDEPVAEEPAAEQTKNTSDSKAEEPSTEAKKAEEAQDVADEKAELAAKALEEAEDAMEADAPNADVLEKAAEEAGAEAEEAQKAADEAQEAAEKAEAEKQEEVVTVETTSPAEEATEAVEEETVSAAANDVKVPMDGETVTHNAQGDITVDIPFEKPGIYTYTITEVAGSDKTITYDSSEKVVVIKVTENEDGSLTPTVVESEGEGTYQFTFNNKYTAPDPGTDFIDPPVKKVIKGPAPETPETYTFKLEAMDESNPMPEGVSGTSMTVDITGEGEKEFGKIYFTKEHAGENGAAKAYDYTVTEVAGDNADCEYDGTVYAVRAYVSIVDGKLKVKREYYKDVEQIDTAKFVFTNTYAEEEEEAGTGTKTGDDTNLLTPIILLLMSGLGIAAAFRFRRREDEN